MSTHSSSPNLPAHQDGPTAAQIAIMQERNRHLRLDDPSDLIPPPASQEDVEDVRRALTETAHNAGVHGLGAFGTVFGLRLSVRWQEIAFNPLNPREDLFAERPDASMETLCKSLSGPYGQITDIMVTPLLPTDPDTANGFKWRVIKGSRRLRGFQLLRKKNPCHIQEVLNREGLPLSRYEQLAYYTIAQVSQKPLSLPEIVRHLAMTFFVFDEEVGEQHAALELPPAETLAVQWSVSRATIYRALQIVRYEPKIIISAIAQRRIPAQAVFELPRVIPEMERRQAIVQQMLDQQQNVEGTVHPPLTVEQVLRYAQGQIGGPTTPVPALPPAAGGVVDADVSPTTPPESVLSRLLRLRPQATLKAQWAAQVLDAITTFERLSFDERRDIPDGLLNGFDQVNREDFRSCLEHWCDL